jgi:hypothetical protein
MAARDSRSYFCGMKTIALLFAMTFPFVFSGCPAFAETPASATFARLKALEGTWDGRVKTTPASEVDGKSMHVTLRVTSMGNTLMHEMTGADRPDDPITMFYVEGDALRLVHYCDAGNRPRMTGKPDADGKTVRFELADISGGLQYGHMHQVAFTFIDENHHIEEWTYMLPNGEHVLAHVELARAGTAGTAHP